MEQEVLPPLPSDVFGGTKWKQGQSGNPNGRTPGVQNTYTKELKTALLQALDAVSGGDGGTSYLIDLAVNHRPLFVGLLKGALPLKIEGGLQVNITAVKRTVVR